MKIAFIGLGVMGFPMAGHLSHGGHQVYVYNRTTKKAEAWVEQYSGVICTSLTDATKDAEIVFACVGNDDDLRQITLGEQGVFDAMAPNAFFVDHSTVSAEVSRELAHIAASNQLRYLDAPVSGGQQGAENGMLTVMVGGDEADFAVVKPIIEHYAREVTLMGPVGNGQLCKMVNQICAVGVIQGLAEGLHFAEASGLDPMQVIDVISKGAAQSWQMENRYKTMIAGEYNHGFAVNWMRKDLAIAKKEAFEKGIKLPLTELIDQFYADVQKMGGERWDTSSLLARLKKRDGLLD